MNPYVKSVRALDDYELEVSFENGECRIFDVKPYLGRGIFVRLRDRSLFQAVRAVAGSIEWPSGLDLSYDTLYLGAQPISAPALEAEQIRGADAQESGVVSDADAAPDSVHSEGGQAAIGIVDTARDTKTIKEARRSTAIHEAGHAVISYAVGRRLMFAVLFDERRGEVMPQCCTCDMCFDYYRDTNPAEDSHSLRIQDELRRDSAVAMAGEIAELAICGDRYIDPNEVKEDRSRSLERASMIHLWTDRDCYSRRKLGASDPCEVCDAFLESLRQVLERLVALPKIRSCIEGLAGKLERRENGKRICEKDIYDFLESNGLTGGSFSNLLPPPPSRGNPRSA